MYGFIFLCSGITRISSVVSFTCLEFVFGCELGLCLHNDQKKKKKEVYPALFKEIKTADGEIHVRLSSKVISCLLMILIWVEPEIWNNIDVCTKKDVEGEKVEYKYFTLWNILFVQMLKLPQRKSRTLNHSYRQKYAIVG